MDPARPSFQLNGPGAAGGNLWSGPFCNDGGSAAARSFPIPNDPFENKGAPATDRGLSNIALHKK